MRRHRRFTHEAIHLTRAVHRLQAEDGEVAGLLLRESLDGDTRFSGHYRLDAVRAHLLEMAGDADAAVERYLAAAGRTASVPERNYLMTQAARLAAERGRHP